MNIVIVSVGTRGDVQPLLGLGSALQRLGHKVRFATNLNFRSMVETCGVEFVPIAPSSFEYSQTPAGLRYQAKGSNPISYFNSIFDMWEGTLDEVFRKAWLACQGADAVLGSTLVLGGGFDIARKLGIPFVLTSLFPVIPTSSFPSYFVPPGLNLGKRLNALSHHAIGALFWSHIRRTVIRWRRETLGDHRKAGPSYSDALCLMGYSRHLVPKPPDWPKNCQVTGFWYADPRQGYEAPSELRHFLEHGPTPICIGFGSVVHERSSYYTDLVVKALRWTGQRCILLTGWGGLQKKELPANIYVTDAVPHDWLFSRVSMVVHAGGAGTTGAVARAGLPSVVVPFTGDQFFWGERVFQFGASARPIRATSLCAQQLAAALVELTESRRIRERARELGELVRAEKGVERAVEILDSEVLKAVRK